MTNGNGNGRIEALLRRAEELKAKLAVEQTKKRRRMEKENARLFGIVGRVICGNVAQNPESFGLMVKQALDTGVTDGAERNFLSMKGLL